MKAIPTIHPAALLFPEMSDEEYVALREDIREHGQREPIMMHEGQILDGRHRYRVCVELDIEPQTTDYLETIDGSPAAYVISKNLHRRHLTSSQKAVIAVESLPLFEAEAKARQWTAGERGQEGGRGHKKDETLPQFAAEGFGEPASETDFRFECQVCGEYFDRPLAHCPHDDHHYPVERETCGNCHEELPETPDTIDVGHGDPAIEPDRIDREARTQAAAVAGTNRQYVSDAKRLKHEAPDLFEEVRQGEKTIPEAKREEIDRYRLALETVGSDEPRPIRGRYEYGSVQNPRTRRTA